MEENIKIKERHGRDARETSGSDGMPNRQVHHFLKLRGIFLSNTSHTKIIRGLLIVLTPP